MDDVSGFYCVDNDGSGSSLHVHEERVLRGLVAVERGRQQQAHLGVVAALERHLEVERPRHGLLRHATAQVDVVRAQVHLGARLTASAAIDNRRTVQDVAQLGFQKERPPWSL